MCPCQQVFKSGIELFLPLLENVPIGCQFRTQPFFAKLCTHLSPLDGGVKLTTTLDPSLTILPQGAGRLRSHGRSGLLLGPVKHAATPLLHPPRVREVLAPDHVPDGLALFVHRAAHPPP